MQIRLDPTLKKEAEAVLTEIGLSATEFTRMALRQLVMKKGIPFETRIPNAVTIAALEEDVSNRPSFSSVDDFLADLHKETD